MKGVVIYVGYPSYRAARLRWPQDLCHRIRHRHDLVAGQRRAAATQDRCLDPDLPGQARRQGDCLYFFGRGSGNGRDGRHLRHRRRRRPVPALLQLSHRQGGALLPKLGIYNVVETLTLSNDYTGNSELCTLFLRECAREAPTAACSPKHRFLFMAEHPELFDSTVFAEMRGVSDGNGHSPSTSGCRSISSRWTFPPSTI